MTRPAASVARHSVRRERDERSLRSDNTGGQRRPAQRPPRERDEHGYGDTQVRQRPPETSQRSASGHRSHGDPSGGQRRPSNNGRPSNNTGEHRTNGESTGGQRRPSNATGEIRTPAKQRRMNIMFVLVILTVCTLFLAATTGSQVMFYGFALSFLSLCRLHLDAGAGTPAGSDRLVRRLDGLVLNARR